MVKLPTVSIIIPAYNEESVIEKCLTSCIAQRDLADEIIVVDNNSTDETAAIVMRLQKAHKTANIRLVYEKEQGMVPARNRGLAEAKSAIFGRIDADSLLEEGWVESVRNTFADPEVMAATGPVVYHDMPMKKIGFSMDRRIRQALHNSAKDHTFLFGSNMAIRANAWREIQDILHRDEDDLLHEDIDLALSLYRKNLKVAYDEMMIAGMSARRIEDNPKDFYNYIMRFERTFQAHNVRSAHARIPIFIYMLIYFPVRTIRKFYNPETNRFTLQKVRDDIREITEKA